MSRCVAKAARLSRRALWAYTEDSPGAYARAHRVAVRAWKRAARAEPAEALRCQLQMVAQLGERAELAGLL